MPEAPKPGDKIRLSYEGVLKDVSVTDRTGGVLYSFDGESAYLKGAAIEILERADDPKNDPIGTVRQHPLGRVVIRTTKADTPWVAIDSTMDTYAGFTHAAMIAGSWQIIGATPGSPASEAQNEPAEFVGRVFLDSYGNEWHEQSPDSFDMRYEAGDWSGLYVGLPLHKVEYETAEDIKLMDKPALNHDRDS